MAKSLEQLLAEEADLKKQIAEARDAQKKEVIEDMKADIEKFDLKPSDLFPQSELKGRKKKEKTDKVSVPVADQAKAAFESGVVFKLTRDDGKTLYWWQGKKGAKPDGIDSPKNQVKEISEIV